MQMWLLCMDDNCLWVYDVNMLFSEYYGYHDLIYVWVDALWIYIMLNLIDCADKIESLEIHQGMSLLCHLLCACMSNYVVYLVFECWCLLCCISIVECLTNHMIWICVYKVTSRNDLVLWWFYSHICFEIVDMYLSVSRW